MKRILTSLKSLAARIIYFFYFLLPQCARLKTFTLIITEPLSDKKTVREIPIVPRRTLFGYLSDRWQGFSHAAVNGRRLPDAWFYHVPQPGERIELHPQTGQLPLTDAYIARLNAKTAGGVFLKALILTENNTGPVKRYFVEHDKTIIFNGNTYYPLSMSWGDFEVSRGMMLPSMRVSVPNMGASTLIDGEEIQAVDYIETKDVLEHDVVLQLLHLDLLGDANAKFERLLQVQYVEADDLICSFVLGWNLGLQEQLPREVILQDEFPGIVRTMAKFSL